MTREIDVHALADHLGEDLGASDWLLIDQDRINRFADVTGDHQWMHVDVERATREMGGTISHGLLIACLLPLLGDPLLHVTGYKGGYSYGFDRLRFTSPVRPGQRVRLHQRIARVEEKQGGIQLALACEMEIEGADRPALVAEYLSLYYP